MSLTVTTKNATTCTASASPADSAWTGSVPFNGSQTIKPTATGKVTYSVTAEGSGGSATASVTVTVNATVPAASLSPTSLDFGNQNVQTSSGPKTVVLANTGNGTLSISGIAVTGGNAGDFSQTNLWGTSLAAGKSCNIVVTFTPTASGVRTASLAVTDNSAGSPQMASLTGTGVTPVLSISPTAPTVLLGGTQSFALNTQASCTSALFGNVPVAGSGSAYTATYTVPQALPSAWTDTLTCAATAGGSQTSAQITLQYPVPVITGTGALGGSLGTLWALQPVNTYFSVNGSGFLPDLNLNAPSNPPSICGINQIAWNQIPVDYMLSFVDFGPRCSTTAPFGWDPGFISLTVSDPAAGHGGGTSNIGRIAFLGDQNQNAVGKTDVFSVDPEAGTVSKWKLSGGTPDGSFVVTPGTILAIGTDNSAGANGAIVVFTDSSVEAFDQATNEKLWEIDAASGGSLLGGAVGDGWAVLSAYDGTEGIPDTLDAINIQQGGPPIHVSYKGTPQDAPWNFQIVDLNNSPTEVVWSAEDGVLSTVEIATQQVIKSLMIPNVFTLKGALSTQIFRGGWQLQAFNSGPIAGTAVLLSQYDQVLVYVDLATMTEIRQVDLTAAFKNANPPQPVLQAFRIGKDEADGSIVVAFADPVNGKTVLYNVDSSGNMTSLSATEPFLATGLQESSDGTQIYWGNRSSFAITPKQ